jgi:hypothetical protein
MFVLLCQLSMIQPTMEDKKKQQHKSAWLSDFARTKRASPRCSCSLEIHFNSIAHFVMAPSARASGAL